MRGWQISTILLACVAAGCVEQRLKHELTRADGTLVTSPGIHLVICGSGSALPDARRAGPCTAVIVGGQVFMVDTGPGSWETAQLSGIPAASLRGVLLTKFLTEEIADLGEVITRSWVAGREAPLVVYGPQGTKRIVADLVDMLQFDVAMRTARHDPAVLRPEFAGAVPDEFTIGAGEASAVVLEHDGLRITAFSGGPIGGVPSVGYRFDYQGRAVVIAGEVPREAIVKFAAGADVLVHPATSPYMIQRGIRVMDELGLVRVASFSREMVKWRPSPVDAARTARDAGVGLLVLTEITPPIDGVFEEYVFLRGVSSVFPNVRIAQDGMRITLEPRT